MHLLTENPLKLMSSRKIFLLMFKKKEFEWKTTMQH